MNSTAYHYHAYGYHICSDICLDDLLMPEICMGNDSVSVFRGDPAELSLLRWPLESGYRVEGSTLWALVKDVCCFRVDDGVSITLWESESTEKDSYKVFLMGSGFAILALQQGFLPIHGSALKNGNQAALICGASGAGKSTLSSQLIARGCALMADDLSIVKPGRDGMFMVEPGFPQQKLWGDTIERLYGSNNGFNRIPGYREKYARSLFEQHHAHPEPVGAMFELAIGDEPSFTRIDGMQAMEAWMRNLYLSELAGNIQPNRHYFYHLAKCAATIPTYRIERKANQHFSEEQIMQVQACMVEG